MRIRRLVVIVILLSALPMVTQDERSPSIPVGLSDPYLIFVPVGWQAESPNPFGFVQLNGADMTLNVLDPIRLEQFIPFTPDISPRQLLIDYTHFFYVETIFRQQIELLTIGENTVAIHQDPELPALATYIVALSNESYALIEVTAKDGTYDETDESTVHAIIGTLTRSQTATSQADILYDRLQLPIGNYSLALPPTWHIEPSFVTGQIFLVGDGIEVIVYPPDSLSQYIDFPPDATLAGLARIMESEFFETDLGNVELTSARAGGRRLVAYGFRSLSNQTDTQVLLVALPDGRVGYFRSVAPQDTLTPVLQDRIRRIAMSLQLNTTDTVGDGLFDDNTEAIIIPNSGQWRIELRNMMRYVCDGTIELLIPLSEEVASLFGDFDTIVADPDGASLTIASDGVVSLFQRATLQREDTKFYIVTDESRGYIITPINTNLMRGRLNLIGQDADGKTCRIGASLTLRYVE